jgi:hypothetical protein
MKTTKLMERFRSTIVAALAIGGALAIGLAIGPTQAAVQGGADALRAASENGSITEQAQFRWGGYDYCWADDGWRGPGWYWCGYAYRPGLGWGGPFGWNNWRRVFRDRDEFRERREFGDRDEFRERREFRERGERGEFREHREFRERGDRR